MATKRLVFDQTFFHAQPLLPNETQYNFFTDNHTSHNERLKDVGEHQIIDWVYNDSFLRNMFVRNIMGTGQTIHHRLRVKEPIIEYGQKPGDVDILMWPDKKPHLAVAIECKRAKVNVELSGKESANRLSQITKGIHQANQLRELGFYKSYVAVFILTDGQNKKDVNTLFRHADSKTISEIYNIPLHTDIHSDVGVIYIQITQPTGLDYNEIYGFGICIDKNAGELEQNKNITSKIERFLDHRS